MCIYLISRYTEFFLIHAKAVLTLKKYIYVHVVCMYMVKVVNEKRKNIYFDLQIESFLTKC